MVVVSFSRVKNMSGRIIYFTHYKYVHSQGYLVGHNLTIETAISFYLHWHVIQMKIECQAS